MLRRPRKKVECGHKREISSVGQFPPQNFKIRLQIQNLLEAVSHQDDHGLVHNGLLQRHLLLFLRNLYVFGLNLCVIFFQLLGLVLVGGLVWTHQRSRILALQILSTLLSPLLFQNARSLGLCSTQWGARLEGTVLALDAGRVLISQLEGVLLL